MLRKTLVPTGLVIPVLAVLALAPPTPEAREDRNSDQASGEKTDPLPSAEIPKPLVIPESARKRQNPVPDVPEAIEAGKALYTSQCAMCHGARGDGKGDVAVSMKMKMPSFADPRVQAKRTDGDLFYIMTTGHGDMPGEKRLLDQNKWEIVRYLRTLAPAPKK